MGEAARVTVDTLGNLLFRSGMSYGWSTSTSTKPFVQVRDELLLLLLHQTTRVSGGWRLSQRRRVSRWQVDRVLFSFPVDPVDLAFVLLGGHCRRRRSAVACVHGLPNQHRVTMGGPMAS